MERFSTVTIRGRNESRRVKIGSTLKPEIQESIINKWQSLIDTVARIVKVPSGLIMRLNEDTIEVFLRSNTEGNPYEKGEKAALRYGLYCETVIGEQQKLLVPDATKSKTWRENNPDVAIDMISYLGYPVNWPDGEVFGTVCLLDNKENNYNKDYQDLLHQIKMHLENDLEILVLNKDLNEINIQLHTSNTLKSKFLSLISHDIRGSVAGINEFIKMIVRDFDQYDRTRLKLILETLGQNASSANDTLENLLSWSRNDILQLQPDLKYINIVDVIENLLFFFNQSILMKGIKVSKSYDSKKAYVIADENMITVVFRNLISNAIKFNNKHGEIQITIKNLGEKQEITIKDSGIGMCQETKEKLFMYDKNHAMGTQGESSAGIGLILTKEFLEKLDAQIDVISETGKGTTVRVEMKGNNII
jgi:c-di-GMP phosphodiesterase